MLRHGENVVGIPASGHDGRKQDEPADRNALRHKGRPRLLHDVGVVGQRLREGGLPRAAEDALVEQALGVQALLFVARAQFIRGRA